MADMDALDLTLLYLLAAVLGVVACRAMHLPPVLGYLGVGIVIGPNALALAQNSEQVRYVAEFGVVFLMFVIGLEFSLTRLRTMGRHVFGLGLTQVATTLGMVTITSTAFGVLAPQWWGMPWQTALALGCVAAMSSTALVMKMTAERGELETEHGKRVVGILLFQDLAVVPLLVLIPALGSPPEALAQALGLAVLKAVLLLLVLLTGGQRVLRWWLALVAKRRSQELFVLNLLLMTLGLAWLTEHAGLSLALGAFVAGMLISETEYKHQVETDIRPFHDVLLGLFFITIGMLLDWRIVWQQWALFLLLLLLPMALKFVLIAGLSRAFGAGPGTSVRVGLYLAQAGEFGLVLLTLAASQNLVPATLFNPLLAAMVVSMLLTPFLIQYSDGLVVRLIGSDWLLQSVQIATIAKQAINTQQHVLICGYGRSGQNLARLLQSQHIPYMALDLDPDRVRHAASGGDSVVFGDASRLQALMAAGLARASAVVVTYPDRDTALKVLAHTQSHAPAVPVIVRTVDDRDLDVLRQAGATEVVPEAIEGSLMLASHALALVGVPARRVLRVIQEQRAQRYGLLRGYFHGADDDTADEQEQVRLLTVTLTPGTHAIGRSWHALIPADSPVQLISLRRAGARLSPEPDTLFMMHDALVLQGPPSALTLAEQHLLHG